MKRMNMDHLRTVLRRGIIAGLALVLAFGTGIESFAAKEGKVTADMANIRSSADAGAERVAQLPTDSTFTVTEETTDSDGHVWYNIVFTLEGAQKSGWIRSDLAEITQDDTQSEEGGETSAEGAVVDGILLLEPTELPEVDEHFVEGQVMVDGIPVTAWGVDLELTGGVDMYLVYGQDSVGTTGWYFYDLELGTLQRAAGQYAGGGADESEGLIEALREENVDLKKEQEKAVSLRNYIIIGLAALCVIFLIVVIVLAVKLSQIEYVDDEYDDEMDDEEDGDEEDDEDDRRSGMPSWMELAKAKKDEERRKKSMKDELEEELEEDEDDFLEAYMSQEKPVVKTVIPEPEKVMEKAVKQPVKVQESKEDFNDEDDFDIELIDLDDLDL